jgi:hypothetical protein
MYDTSADNTAQLQAFLLVLASHRLQLEQQLEDIRITLAEIEQHEQRCRSLIAADGQPAGTDAVALVDMSSRNDLRQ